MNELDSDINDDGKLKFVKMNLKPTIRIKPLSPCYILLLLLLLSPHSSCFVLPLTSPLRSISGTSLASKAFSEAFNWSSIEPQATLRYTPCYRDLECARLLVPLDWTRPDPDSSFSSLEPDSSSWQQIALAVVRLPAKVNQSDPSFGGSIVLNPGGPSGSGVDLVRWSGKGIQEIVDGEKKQKSFEILSFDPRGTKYSTPSSACFESDEDRDAWGIHNSDTGSTDDGSFSLNVKWALSQGFGHMCDQTKLGVFPDGTNVRQYVSTAQVAHDMVRLTDAIDEELKSATAHAHNVAVHDQAVLSVPSAKANEVPLLNYWGYSYGTLLGNTFASMFPHRIGRIILDGVVDALDYSATGWSTNLQDNDRVWDFFFQWCFEAGSACALYSNAFQSASDIRAQFRLFTDFLKDNPVSVVYDGRFYLLTYSVLQTAMHYGSYAPYQLWPNLAISIQQLMAVDYGASIPGRNNLSLSSSSFSALFYPHNFEHQNQSHGNQNDNDDRKILNPFNNSTTPYPPNYPHATEASTAILCGDGDDITYDTKTYFKQYVAQLKSQSALVGPHWSQLTLLCRHWPKNLRPARRNRFTGPFGSKLQDYRQTQAGNVKRSSPILFIGNTADPVTPLRNAINMAKQHEGSRVLIQDSPGHCSGVNIPSKCSWKVISDFFTEGLLPENGTRCYVDWKPWDFLPAQ